MGQPAALDDFLISFRCKIRLRVFLGVSRLWLMLYGYLRLNAHCYSFFFFSSRSLLITNVGGALYRTHIRYRPYRSSLSSFVRR